MGSFSVTPPSFNYRNWKRIHAIQSPNPSTILLHSLLLLSVAETQGREINRHEGERIQHLVCQCVAVCYCAPRSLHSLLFPLTVSGSHQNMTLNSVKLLWDQQTSSSTSTPDLCDCWPGARSGRPFTSSDCRGPAEHENKRQDPPPRDQHNTATHHHISNTHTTSPRATKLPHTIQSPNTLQHTPITSW